MTASVRAYRLSQAGKEAMRAKSEHIWPAEKVSLLTQLYGEGVPTAEIGRRMGITKNTVIGKATRLGLERRENVLLTNNQKAAHARRGEGAAPNFNERMDALSRFAVDRNTCAFPIGDVTDADFHYCGLPAPGAYCTDHAKLCYQRGTAT